MACGTVGHKQTHRGLPLNRRVSGYDRCSLSKPVLNAFRILEHLIHGFIQQLNYVRARLKQFLPRPFRNLLQLYLNLFSRTDHPVYLCHHGLLYDLTGDQTFQFLRHKRPLISVLRSVSLYMRRDLCVNRTAVYNKYTSRIKLE